MIKLQPFARTAFHALTFVALPYEQTDRFEDRLARCTCESLYILKGFGLRPNFPPVISRVRRLFRPSWGVWFWFHLHPSFSGRPSLSEGG
jgi:hypothetical protein